MSELVGLARAARSSLALKSGSLSLGWLRPTGSVAKHEKRSRYQRPERASHRRRPRLLSRSSTRSKPSTSRWRASTPWTSDGAIRGASGRRPPRAPAFPATRDVAPAAFPAFARFARLAVLDEAFSVLMDLVSLAAVMALLLPQRCRRSSLPSRSREQSPFESD